MEKRIKAFGAMLITMFASALFLAVCYEKVIFMIDNGVLFIPAMQTLLCGYVSIVATNIAVKKFLKEI